MSVETIGYNKIQELVMQVPMKRLPDLYRVMIKIIEDDVNQTSHLNFIKRIPPSSIAGKAKIKGDIVNPIVDEEDWECLK